MKQKTFLLVSLLILSLTCFAKKQQYDVAAFVYPGYASDDPRLRPFWPAGMGEWETVYNMQQRHPGHYWNRHPLWGYINEADPSVMEMEIEQATSHGVNVFIFDWYWYDDRPFMETTLANGFLKARNNEKMKFYLMWANHDWSDFVDTRMEKLKGDNYVWQGSLDRQEFERICKRNIEMFFKLPNYYKIDGKPVFMIYDVPNLIKGLGGIEQTKDALRWFTEETKRAGFPGLDIQMTMWSLNTNCSGVDGSKSDMPANEFVTSLGFTSSTHYQYAHMVPMNDEYLNIHEKAMKEWERSTNEFTIPYYPHVSIGWDNSPRRLGSACVRNNTPENFQKALEDAKAFVDSHPKLHPLITINSWNEWTETSYLQPDDVNGYGYLEAVKKVFINK